MKPTDATKRPSRAELIAAWACFLLPFAIIVLAVAWHELTGRQP